MSEKKKSKIGRITLRPDQLDLDLQDVLRDFYLPDETSLVLNIPLKWDPLLRKWTLASVGAATEETLTTIAKETTLKDIYNQLYNFLGGHKLKNFFSSSGSVSVPANSNNAWLYIVGIGYAILLHTTSSTGIPASNALFEVHADGFHDLEVRIPDIWYCNYFGLTTVGNYSMGHKAFRVHTWDTVNHIYTVHQFARANKTPFRNSLMARMSNTHPTSSATMIMDLQYCLYAATKRIVLKHDGMPDVLNAMKKMKKANIAVSAITSQLLGYFENEEKHPYREFINDFPNRKENITNPLCAVELYVDESVPLGKVKHYFKPLKIVYEEE